jgi:hypothetical protein
MLAASTGQHDDTSMPLLRRNHETPQDDPKIWGAFGTVHLRLPFLRRGRSAGDVRVPQDGRLDLQETLDEDGAPVALH